MDFESVPIVRLELENMRRTILRHMGVEGSELGAVLNKRISEAIKTYNFSTKVSAIANSVIDEQINAYFRHGLGRKCIQKAVQDALDKTFIGEKEKDD